MNLLQRLKNIISSPEFRNPDYMFSPIRVFAIVAVIFGGIMLFVMPPFMVPDERVHFYRAYQVGEGKLLSETNGDKIGGVVTPVPDIGFQDIQEDRIGNLFSVSPAPSERFETFPSSALYSPVPYIPQAIGIDVGRLVHSSIEFMVFFGRLVNLLVYIGLVLLAIKIAKQGKWVYVAAGLFPLAIQQAASLSTDVMTIGFSFVAIAYIHRLFFQRASISRKQVVVLAALAVVLGVTKQTNLVILAPILFLPIRLFGAYWRKAAFVVLIALIGLIAALGWYAITKHSYQNLELTGICTCLEGVNQVGQVKNLLSNPIDFIPVLFRTYVFEGFKGVSTADFYWTSAYGYFSTFTYKLPLILISLGYVSLLAALLSVGEAHAKNAKRRLLNTLAGIQTVTFLAGMLAVAVALYVIWTPVGAHQVSGIQGRYFIPILPLLIPLFGVLGRYVRLTFDKPYRLGVIIALISTVNLSAMVILTQRFFY